jgi:hypothetical protein
MHGGGNIFLGDQIHAVLQRRHHADLRGAIKAREHILTIALVEIADWRPVDFAVSAVDIADEPCDFALQIALGLIAPREGVAICSSDTARDSCGCKVHIRPTPS